MLGETSKAKEASLISSAEDNFPHTEKFTRAVMSWSADLMKRDDFRAITVQKIKDIMAWEDGDSFSTSPTFPK